MIRGKASEKPKLKTKAAEGRRLLPIVVHMLQHSFGLDTDHKLLRFQCAKALNNIYEEFKNWSSFESPDRIRTWSRQHIILFRRLCDTSKDEMMWCMFPKHHLFLHAADVIVTNPSLEWNYSEESEIFAVVKLCKRTHGSGD